MGKIYHVKRNKLIKKQAENQTQIPLSCYDLQAVVQLPKGKVSTFYYKRKLNTFDFTIYDATAKQGYCYIWHEAKRGSLEISSFVYDYLKEYCNTDKK